jgi:hypothetical protein
MSLFAELANNTRVEIKVGSGDVHEQIRQIRGDAEGSAPRWIETTDGSWIQVAQIVRLDVVEDEFRPKPLDTI